MTDAELVARYDGRVPRYTSYPTAPHFSPAFPASEYAAWLEMLPAGEPVSIYLHVPFCERLCLYCGCTTSVVRHEGTRRAYADLLGRELRLVAARLGRRAPVAHVHWGGGTPTTLPDDCLTGIMGVIRGEFALRPDAEVAIEIDPSVPLAGRLAALDAMGITRASLGVQDFDPKVQQAIGRIQSFETTEDCARLLRGLGVGSINLDLIYGLPHQTEASVARTARRVLDLEPDRIAVFGYAHVPWMKRHQRLLPEAALPDPQARFAQCRVIGQVLQEAGFVPVGLDHYARPGDGLAAASRAGRLRRSFQGYTTDDAALIGIGASAIGCLPGGYVQNAPDVPGYRRAIFADRFATVRGIALTADDRLRRDVIETIMCDLRADLKEIALRHGAPPDALTCAAGLERFEADGLVRRAGFRLEVTEAGRPFVRSIAAVFDAYLDRGNTMRHARAV
jgi:oxygen-independent coproporphyrinogen III oxidase